MPDQPLPVSRRRWLRLSVRGLIILALIIGGWFGWLARGARIRREAVAVIQRAGGQVYYDWQRFGDLVYSPTAKPRGPRWLVDRIGVDYFGDPVAVYFSSQQPEKPDDAIMVPVGHLRR